MVVVGEGGGTQESEPNGSQLARLSSLQSAQHLAHVHVAQSAHEQEDLALVGVRTLGGACRAQYAQDVTQAEVVVRLQTKRWASRVLCEWCN